MAYHRLPCYEAKSSRGDLAKNPNHIFPASLRNFKIQGANIGETLASVLTIGTHTSQKCFVRSHAACVARIQQPLNRLTTMMIFSIRLKLSKRLRQFQPRMPPPLPSVTINGEFSSMFPSASGNLLSVRQALPLTLFVRFNRNIYQKHYRNNVRRLSNAVFFKVMKRSMMKF